MNGGIGNHLGSNLLEVANDTNRGSTLADWACSSLECGCWACINVTENLSKRMK
jgi:hypothetical protein